MEGDDSGMRILDVVSDRIIAITSPRMVFLSLLGFLITAFLINGRPFGVAQLNEITGGVGLLDMEFLYTPQQAYAHLAAMGEAGRAFDLTHIVPLDLVFPFMYTLFYAVTMTWFLRQWLPKASGWYRLNVIPVIGGTCDYLENAGIIAMLLAWPTQLEAVAQFAMVAGLVKFGAIILAGIIIMIAFAGWAVTSVRRRCRAAAA